MTCIVGLLDKGDVWMGADSAGSSAYTICDRRDTKLFRNGPFLMGFTTSFRMGQLLHYSFKTPDHPARMSDEKYMCTKFIDAARKCFKRGGYAKKKDEHESGGTFLVGYKGRIFQVESDYQVGIARGGFDAVGCGGELALGSLFTTRNAKMRPAARLRLALQAAAKFSKRVRGPFRIMCLKGG